MTNLARIQPWVRLIIHYTGVQQTVDYKRMQLKENHFPFTAFKLHHMEEKWQDLRKKIISYTAQSWRLQDDQQISIHQSENYSKSIVITMFAEKWHPSSLQLSKEARSQAEVKISSGISLRYCLNSSFKKGCFYWSWALCKWGCSFLFKDFFGFTFPQWLILPKKYK